LIACPGGFVVEVTDGTTDYNPSRYRISVFYDLAKVAMNRLSSSQALVMRLEGPRELAALHVELQGYVTSVSVGALPGFRLYSIFFFSAPLASKTSRIVD
jgi:hypothetical protein